MTAKIFIDGAAGTTGLEIRERLEGRRELKPIVLSDARRKDPSARKAALNEADVVILCLPDEAAREAVSLIENSKTRVIDASTAHRTQNGWVFGFPEMQVSQRNSIRGAARVSNPGCYPTGFIALMRPLIRAGLIPETAAITCNAVSGYSGGGRGMIAEFEDKKAPDFTKTVFRTYALTLEHKHVDEMRKHSGLKERPLFAPSVGRFYRGMLVEIPLQLWALETQPKPGQLHEALAEAYRGEPLIEVAAPQDAAALKTVDAEELKDTNRMKLYVFGNPARQQARLVAVLDNLGKGASGAAVQNLNVMLGLKETGGLV
jgi:N-acetyl-gamma-glutamyl-phosphate reductase